MSRRVTTPLHTLLLLPQAVPPLRSTHQRPQLQLRGQQWDRHSSHSCSCLLYMRLQRSRLCWSARYGNIRPLASNCPINNNRSKGAEVVVVAAVASEALKSTSGCSSCLQRRIRPVGCGRLRPPPFVWWVMTPKRRQLLRRQAQPAHSSLIGPPARRGARWPPRPQLALLWQPPARPRLHWWRATSVNRPLFCWYCLSHSRLPCRPPHRPPCPLAAAHPPGPPLAGRPWVRQPRHHPSHTVAAATAARGRRPPPR